MPLPVPYLSDHQRLPPVVNRFRSKEVSIHLDTRPPEEQDHFKVSLVTAKLPLLSPFAVSVKDKLRIGRQQGRTYQVLFYSRAGPYLLFDVQVFKPKTPAV
jgi:hypothetical protein